MPLLCRTLILRYPTPGYLVAPLISAILSQVTVRFNEIRSNFFQWLPGRVCLSLSKK